MYILQFSNFAPEFLRFNLTGSFWKAADWKLAWGESTQCDNNVPKNKCGLTEG